MKSKRLNPSQPGEKLFALVFQTGDQVAENLLNFAKKEGLAAAHFTAIGALKELTLGYFDWDEKEYQKIPVNEQVEVLSLVGNIVKGDDGPKLHAHIVVGKRDGTAHGGHLVEATVRPTLEVMLTETPAHLARKHDEASGLALIQI